MQLLELKKEFERNRLELAYYHNLLTKREFELQKIHVLKANLEAKLIQMHHLATTNAQKAQELKEQISEETEHITILKKIVKNIDQELDQIGEEKEGDFTKLKQNLIAKIQEKFPTAIEEYQSIEMHLKETRQEEEWLIRQKLLADPLFAIFKTGSEIKLKGGFFDFLLGKNPKALLARSIHNATNLAEKIYPEVQEGNFKHFLERFLNETKKPWNKELYRGKFAELFEKLSLLIIELQQRITYARKIIDEKEQAIEQWIEKYCKI